MLGAVRAAKGAPGFALPNRSTALSQNCRAERRRRRGQRAGASSSTPGVRGNGNGACEGGGENAPAVSAGAREGRRSAPSCTGQGPDCPRRQRTPRPRAAAPWSCAARPSGRWSAHPSGRRRRAAGRRCTCSRPPAARTGRAPAGPWSPSFLSGCAPTGTRTSSWRSSARRASSPPRPPAPHCTDPARARAPRRASRCAASVA